MIKRSIQEEDITIINIYASLVLRHCPVPALWSSSLHSLWATALPLHLTGPLKRGGAARKEIWGTEKLILVQDHRLPCGWQGFGAPAGCQTWASEVGEPSSGHWSTRDLPAHVISNGESSPRDLHLNAKTQLHSMTSKLQCWTPFAKQLARQEWQFYLMIGNA